MLDTQRQTCWLEYFIPPTLLRLLASRFSVRLYQFPILSIISPLLSLFFHLFFICFVAVAFCLFIWFPFIPNRFIGVHSSPSESIVHQLPSSKSSFDPVSVDDAALDSMTRRYIQPVWPTWQVCAANKQQLTFIDILCKLHKICPRKVFVKDLICDMFQRKTMLKVECRSQAWSPSSPACSELSSNAKSKTIKLVIYI